MESTTGTQPTRPTAVAILHDPVLRGWFPQACEQVGFRVEVYPTVRRWPFMGEIRAGRCYRTDRCGAHVLAVDASPDVYLSGPELLHLQATQGCRCMEPGYAGLAKLAFIVGPEASKLLQLGVAVFPPEGHGVREQVGSWLQQALKRPSWTLAPVEREVSAGSLFMRCPYTNKVVPADSLKVLQEHFASLGHILAPRQVIRIRDRQWCDAAGTLGPPPEGVLEQWRLANQ